MDHLLAPAILLAVLPLYYFAHRCGFLASRRGRLATAAVAVLTVLASLPWNGIGLAQQKRVDFLIAGAAAALLLARHFELGWVAKERYFLGALGALAGLALLVHVNFFSFHGEHTYIHYHDAGHYYLGAKYFDELGYTGLYTAILRAEAEIYENHFKAFEARDLKNNELVDIRVLLGQSEEVKAAFSTARWEEWKRDVALFRERMTGEHWRTFLSDQGFNPPPTWAVVGGAVAGLVPAGSHRGLLLLTLLDPFLLLVAFAAFYRVFGRETALVALLFFCVAFGASFGWTGGAFLRYMWFFGMVVGLCAIERRRGVLAGMLLGVATLLRVFPILFVFGLAVRALAEIVGERRLSPFYRRFFISFALTGLALFASTVTLEDGLSTWRGFRENTEIYVKTLSPNVVGMTSLLSYQGRPRQVTLETFKKIEERRHRIHRFQLKTVFVLAVVLVAALAARARSDIEAFALGLVLLFTSLNMGCYYYVVLIVLVPVRRENLRHLALLFTGETLVYALQLFEEADGMLFIYRSLLVLYLLAAVYRDEVVGLWRFYGPSRSATISSR